jgi:hypothetical protein
LEFQNKNPGLIDYHIFIYQKSLPRTLQRLFLFVNLQMQKFFRFLIFSLAVFTSCQSDHKLKETETVSPGKETQMFFPVTDFLLGQLHELDSLPITPLRTMKIDDSEVDSVWLKREDIRNFATPFITPVIDSVSMSPYFSTRSFLDQTINSITLTYDPKIKLPKNIHLRHWDVYVDPQKGTVQRIYIVKEFEKDGISTTVQLTWNVNFDFSIRTIEQASGGKPIIKVEKMAWNFD